MVSGLDILSSITSATLVGSPEVVLSLFVSDVVSGLDTQSWIPSFLLIRVPAVRCGYDLLCSLSTDGRIFGTRWSSGAASSLYR